MASGPKTSLRKACPLSGGYLSHQRGFKHHRIHGLRAATVSCGHSLPPITVFMYIALNKNVSKCYTLEIAGDICGTRFPHQFTTELLRSYLFPPISEHSHAGCASSESLGLPNAPDRTGDDGIQSKIFDSKIKTSCQLPKLSKPKGTKYTCGANTPLRAKNKKQKNLRTSN